MTGFGFEVTDAAQFLARAGDQLAADPVLATVVATSAERDVKGISDVHGPDHWYLTVLDGDEVVGAAMRTAPSEPWPIFVLPLPEAAAVQLAGWLAERPIPVTRLNGALPTVQVCADELARRSGRRVTVAQHTRLFELTTLRPPRAVAGRLRPAVPADLALARDWYNRFHDEAERQAGRTPEPGPPPHDEASILRRIEVGRVWLWDVDGRVVHLSGVNPPSFGVRRIGPVFTPPEERGRGWASAGVAALSAQILAGGHRACLFTDQANPTSNRVYTALGYEPVTDMVNLALVPEQVAPTNSASAPQR